ncbi:MAG: di-trans,poly-cis-decaprenylcistransferase, partial [Chitinivibrionales bacterium]|nr:di-trans,poly-cis-decaprenylcistransferase [Chitinivibrionales bacterium]
CGELGVKYLTIYVFSAENWGRPKNEVNFLMELFVEMIHKETQELNRKEVRLHTIGDLSRLPPKTFAELTKGIETTKSNTGLNLILAISYGGRSEIVHAVKEFSKKACTDPSLIDSLDEKEFSRYLYTSSFPDPELIIRTGGDMRISNFLLWQIAYAELYVTDVLWPDFNKQRLIEAIEDYSKRERRFGKVSTFS